MVIRRDAVIRNCRPAVRIHAEAFFSDVADIAHFRGAREIEGQAAVRYFPTRQQRKIRRNRIHTKAVLYEIFRPVVVWIGVISSISRIGGGSEKALPPLLQ